MGIISCGIACFGLIGHKASRQLGQLSRSEAQPDAASDGYLHYSNGKKHAETPDTASDGYLPYRRTQDDQDSISDASFS